MTTFKGTTRRILLAGLLALVPSARISTKVVMISFVVAGQQNVAFAQDAFSEIYDHVKSGITTACNGRDDCLRMGASFVWFMWNNRDKADLQYNLGKCAVTSAISRGYVWSPTTFWEDLTPSEVMNVSVEICDCVIGYWGKEPICRRALVGQEIELLTEIFDD